MKKILQIILIICSITLVVSGAMVLSINKKEKKLQEEIDHFSQTELYPKIENAQKALEENRVNRLDSGRLEPLDLETLETAQPAMTKMNEYRSEMNDLFGDKILPMTLVKFTSGFIVLCVATLINLERLKKQTQPGGGINSEAAPLRDTP